MRNTYVLRFRTKEKESLKAFQNLMKELQEPIDVLCDRGGNLLESFYVLEIEHLKLIDFKKKVDDTIPYDSLDLFEFEDW